MDVHHESVDFDFPFWPIEHPVEPQDEDKPIKCPIPNSAALKEGGKQEEKYIESQRKRSEEAEKWEGEAKERSVRKRHHSLTLSEDLIIPSTPTIFQMLQNLDKFEY